MNETIFEFKGTKEQSLEICKNAFIELLKNFDIKQTEDLLTKDLTIKMTPKELSTNKDKMYWLNIFMKYKNDLVL